MVAFSLAPPGLQRRHLGGQLGLLAPLGSQRLLEGGDGLLAGGPSLLRAEQGGLPFLFVAVEHGQACLQLAALRFPAGAPSAELLDLADEVGHLVFARLQFLPHAEQIPQRFVAAGGARRQGDALVVHVRRRVLASLAQLGDFALPAHDPGVELGDPGLALGEGRPQAVRLAFDPGEIRLHRLQFDPEELELLAESPLLGAARGQVLFDRQQVQLRLPLGHGGRLDGALGMGHVIRHDGQGLAQTRETDLADGQGLLQFAQLAPLCQESLRSRGAADERAAVREHLAGQSRQGEGAGEFPGDGQRGVQVVHDHGVRQEVDQPGLGTFGRLEEIQRHPLDAAQQFLGQVGEPGREILSEGVAPGPVTRRHGSHQRGPPQACAEEVREGLVRLGPGLDPHALEMGPEDRLQCLLVPGCGFQHLGQGAQDPADAAIPTRLEKQLVALREIGELQPELAQGAQPAPLALHIRGESGDLGFQMTAGLARARGLEAAPPRDPPGRGAGARSSRADGSPRRWRMPRPLRADWRPPPAAVAAARPARSSGGYAPAVWPARFA